MICWEHAAVTGFGACHLPGLPYSFLENCGRCGYPRGSQFPWTWGFSAFFQLDSPSRSSEKSGIGSHLFISIWFKGEEVVQMLAFLLGRVLSCVAEYPHGCCYSHPWDHCTNTHLFLSQRWLQSSLSLIYFLVTVWHPHGISCRLS